MSHTSVIVLNINPNANSKPITITELINYFLITATVLSAIFALLNVILKIKQKIKSSPYFEFGIKQEIKCERSDVNYACECAHKFKLHIIGEKQVINEIFPRIKWQHLCGTLLICCVINRCKVASASLILPRQQMSIITSGEYQTYQIGFNHIPMFEESKNILWDKSFVSNIVRIDTDTQGNCSQPWLTPLGLITDRPTIINIYDKCKILINVHIRQTSNETLFDICSFNETELQLLINHTRLC